MNVFLYAVTVIAWGLSWYAVQMQLGAVTPEVSVLYRFALSAAVMVLFCLVTGRRINFTFRNHLAVAAQGLFLFGSNFYLVYLGSQYLPSGLVSILFSLLVVMTMAGSALVFRAPIDGRVIIGAGFGIAGIATVFWPDLMAFNANGGGASSRGPDGLFASIPDSVLGIGLVLSGTLSATIGMLISAWNQRRGLGVVRTNTLGMAYGAAFFALYCLAKGSEFTMDWSTRYVGSLLFLSLVSTVIAFATYLTLVGRIGPERAAYASVMFPIVALAVSTWVEGFQWTITAVLGVMLVLAGNLFVLAPRGTPKVSVPPPATGKV